MTQQDYDQLKLTQLEIMDEIHRICVEHNIQYYIIGGTLLGAVRHQGFIPWDIDIDVAMMRDDYDKFKDICKTELGTTYAYCDYLNKKRFRHPHALVCKKNTEIVFKYDKYNPKYENLGVYVDIFPLDNAPENETLQITQSKRLIKIKKLKHYRIPYSCSYSWLKRMMHFLVSAAMVGLSVRRINHMEQKEMQRYRDVTTQFVCSMSSQYAYKKQCVKKEVYGIPVLLNFEGRQYYAPSQYISYLSRLYGDYMKLPPVEKRKVFMEKIVSVSL